MLISHIYKNCRRKQGKKVKKVKSLVKKLLGRSTPPPYKIDVIQRTAVGYCVIGWYFTDSITDISILNSDSTKADVNRIAVDRDDVLQATGKPAVGFELHISTSKSIDSFTLVAITSSGKKLEKSLANFENSAVAQDISDIDTTPLASTVISAKHATAACEFVITTNSHIFVAGWLISEYEFANMRLLDRHDNVVAECEDCLRVNRRDVLESYKVKSLKTDAGFSLLFKRIDTNDENSASEPAFVAFTINGEHIRLPIDNIFNALDDPIQNTMRLLNSWAPDNPHHLTKANVFLPVLHGTFPADTNVEVFRFDFNQQPDSPDASLIIPLYGRFDFMRYQLSYFGRTAKTANCEIIYVVDDPTIAEKVLKLAREMAQISTQSFSVLQLSQNVGFGKANNIGVEHANADIIALVNSDILPKTANWLELLIDTANQEGAGIVGARLLFEDESIQHDGMAPMTLAEYPGILFNDHPRKGWPKDLSPYQSAVAPCSMITAACWVMKKALFEKLGGFAPEYVLGDFEDSDLCLRAQELGKKNYIRRDVELYHLERQSQNLVQPGKWKHSVTLLNAVHFNNKWKATLEKMQEAEV